MPGTAPVVSPDAPPTASSAALAYTTRRFSALGHDFAVRTNDEALGRYLDDLFGCLARAGQPSTHYTILDRGAASCKRFELRFGGDLVVQSPVPPRVLEYLLWHVNRQVVACAGDLVPIHAAAAAIDGGALLLAGPAGSGKSTLVAGLVRRGFAYLTDEVAAIDPLSLLVRPFPRPLSIEAGSQGVLADLEPVVDPDAARYLSGTWHVNPHSIRAGDTVSPPAPVRWVMFPRYQRGAPTELVPLGRAEALIALLDNCFDNGSEGARRLITVGQALAEARCWRLVTGDLDEACELVARELGMRA